MFFFSLTIPADDYRVFSSKKFRLYGKIGYIELGEPPPYPTPIKKSVFFKKKVQKYFADIKMFLIFALLTRTKATNV